MDFNEQTSHNVGHCLLLGLAPGPSDPPAVWVWTTKTGRFRSRTVQKTDPLALGALNPEQYPSTRGFRQVSLDQSVLITDSAFRVSHF